MNNKKILNFSMVIVYTVLMIIIAALLELFLSGIPAPDGLISINGGLAETGFSVAVIAVSILAVITNISGQRFFGIKAGEYLKFRRRTITPGFYDVLIIIVLLGAIQYVALAIGASYAAAVIFIEIIILMIIQIRWGLGIAFFYYDKEKEIRAFLIGEIQSNLKIIKDDKASKKRKERAQLSLISRIDNLFAHTKQAVAIKETTQVAHNLSLMSQIFGLLLGNEYQSVWHNYETRVDDLLSSLIGEQEYNEYVISALVKMTDEVLATKESDDKLIAMNCDFDRTRNQSYKMLFGSATKILENMFEKKLFYRLALVKIYGIKNIERKAARYAVYTDQFAQSVAASENLGDIKTMIAAVLRKLAPMCFEEGKATETAIYFCMLLQSLSKQKIELNSLWEESTNNVEDNEKTKHSICMLKKVIGINAGCKLSKEETQIISEFTKLIEKHK